jgi:hypothetical protein
MSLFDSASICITPNGQKAGKLYSIKPTDGSGDLIVTRATSATRVDANGLVEIPRTNLALYSEQFDNAYWTKTRCSITANATTAPNGNLTADKLVENTDTNSHFVDRTFTTVASTIYTYSVYAKKSEREFIVLECLTTGKAIFVSLNDGSLGTRIGYLVSDINVETLANGWFRISVKDTSPSTVLRYINTIAISSSSANYAGNGTSGIFIWGAQLEQGNVATEYIPTVASIRTKFAGITQDGSSASNIPRLDYTNGSCPSILVEPQRTNLALRSNELSTTPNVLDGVVATTNFYTSPDGSTNAIRLAETVANDRHGFFQYYTVTAQTYTVSVFTKQIGRRYISLMSDLNGTNTFSFFDLQNKVVVSSGAGYTCSIKEYADGWLRLSATVNASIGSRYTIWGGSTNGNTNTYVGNTSTFMTFYGLQFEAGANATSYIPTTSASVTRNADVISKTGISSLIGQTEGTIFVDIDLKELPQSTQRFIQLKGTSFDIFIRSGAYAITGMSTITFTQITGRMKIAAIYSNNLAKLFINGIEIGSRTSVTISNTNSIGIGNDALGGNINSTVQFNSIQLYKTALTDDECINLTTI